MPNRGADLRGAVRGRDRCAAPASAEHRALHLHRRRARVGGALRSDARVGRRRRAADACPRRRRAVHHLHERHDGPAQRRGAQQPRLREARRNPVERAATRRRRQAAGDRAALPHRRAQPVVGAALARRHGRAASRLRCAGGDPHDRARAHHGGPPGADDGAGDPRRAELRRPRPVEPAHADVRRGADAGAAAQARASRRSDRSSSTATARPR